MKEFCKPETLKQLMGSGKARDIAARRNWAAFELSSAKTEDPFTRFRLSPEDFQKKYSDADSDSDTTDPDTDSDWD